MDRIIYMDYQASTPVDNRVLDAMLPWLKSKKGNPHSIHHHFGQESADAVSNAQGDIADAFGVLPEDVIFTSGATEANNLAIFGLARASWRTRPRLVAPQTEHKSVLEPLLNLEKAGFELELIPVNRDGLIDLSILAKVLNRGPAIVSTMAVNSEIGVVQPMAEIGKLCQNFGAILHCDASQAVGKIAVQIDSWNVDILTFSGHKIYGPMGIGGLIANATIRRRIEPMLVGGGQQNAVRAGTVPTFLCVGLAKAVALSVELLPQESKRLLTMRQRLLDGLQKTENVVLNGSATHRVPGNLNVQFLGVDAMSLIALANGVAMSTGSACASTGGSRTNSHVLVALGLDEECIRSSVRLGIGRFTKFTEIDSVIMILTDAAKAARLANRKLILT